MKPTYTNDRKAPRMRKKKFSENLIGPELFKKFRLKYPEYKGKSDKELREIWADLAKTIREETVTNPLGVKLGSYTGELKLQYLPHKFDAIVKDDKVTEEVGHKIKHTNILTRGKVGTIKWERRWAVKFNKVLQFFAFKETRQINILAKSHIDANPEKLRMSRITTGGKSIWRKLK